MSRKKEILKEVSAFSAATIVSQLITLVASILSRRFLGPTNMGIWAFIQVILTYASFSSLGTTEATHREIPFYRGQGDEKKAEEVKNSVFSFALLSTFVLSIGFVLYALFARAYLQETLFFGLFFTAILAMLQRFNNLLVALLRAYRQFTLASKQMIWSAIVNAIAVAWFAYRFQMYGFMVAQTLSLLFNIIYIRWHYHFKLKWKLNWSVVKNLIGYGFPIMILGVMSMVFLTIDKLMITKFLGFEALGLYSIAILATTYVTRFSNAAGIVLLPNFHERYGKSQNTSDLKGHIVKSSMAFSNVMPFLIAAGWIIFPPLVGVVLPQFIGGIVAVKYLILSSYFLALSTPHEIFIVAIRKHWTLYPVVLLSCILAAIFDYFAIRLGYGLAGIAAATTVMLFCKFVVTYVLSARYVFSRKEGIRLFLSVIWKFFFLVAVLMSLDHFISFRSLPLTASIQLLCFGLLFLPLLRELNREFELIALISEKWTQLKIGSPKEPGFPGVE